MNKNWFPIDLENPPVDEVIDLQEKVLLSQERQHLEFVDLAGDVRNRLSKTGNWIKDNLSEDYNLAYDHITYKEITNEVSKLKYGEWTLPVIIRKKEQNAR